MNTRMLGLTLTLLIVIAAAGGAIYYFSGDIPKPMVGVKASGGASAASTSDANTVSTYQMAESNEETALQKELRELTEKMITELRAEERLNLTMVPQLRTFRDMLQLIQNYAKKIEMDIDIIKEISKNAFQEDVTLQAALFKGKKSKLVAKHLEEFNAGRVGAILAKMKTKEAGDVLDVWAVDGNPEIGKFYRSVMAAYLNNRRRDMDPKLFDKLSQKARELPGEV